MQYASKLDEFEMFVSRAKYPPLQLRPLAPATTSAASASRPITIPASSSIPVTATENHLSRAAAAAASSQLRASSTPAAAATQHQPQRQHQPQHQPQPQPQHQRHQSCQDGRAGWPLHPILPLPLPRLTLIDDVPHAADADARRRLSIALQVGEVVGGKRGGKGSREREK